MGKRLGVDTAMTAGPNWLKRYSLPCVMLRNKNEAGGESFSKVAIAQRSPLVGRSEWLPLHHLVPLQLCVPPLHLLNCVYLDPWVFLGFALLILYPILLRGSEQVTGLGFTTCFQISTHLWLSCKPGGSGSQQGTWNPGVFAFELRTESVQSKILQLSFVSSKIQNGSSESSAVHISTWILTAALANFLKL